MSLQVAIDRLLAAWHERSAFVKALSFGAIGVVNTLVDFGVFLLAHTALKSLALDVLKVALNPEALLIVANVLAWIVAVSCSYVMNSFITFARESGRVLRWRDYGTFAASGVAGMIANTTTLVVLSYWVPVYVAKLCAVGVSFLVNFSLSHFVVFRTRRDPAQDAG
jgi:putative flippase GtrA